MSPVGVRFTDGAVWPGGTAEKNSQDRGDGMMAFTGGRGTCTRNPTPGG